jgi:hypothetical protein
MSKDEKELLEKYRRLLKTNKVNALSNIRVALASQEAVKRQYGITTPTGEARADREQPAQAGKSA